MSESVQDLAATGGTPVRSAPFPDVNGPSGRRIGAEEIEAVVRVLTSAQLNSTVGQETRRWEAEFAAMYGIAHAAACSSGTAAIHLAIAAVDPDPGDEIITSPITDAGTVLPIVAQNAVPVFADVDLCTGALDVASVEAAITPRTKAIVAVHPFGYPAPVHELRKLADRHGLVLIEDCAQAFGTLTDRGELAGTVGHLGCFSLQQSKHITCGDGGIVITSSADLDRRARLFADKAWPRDTDERTHLFLGLNYRMTELQAAVARAQLAKLDSIIADRRRAAARLAAAVEDLDGIRTRPVDGSSVWLFPLFVDPLTAGVDGARFADLLRAEGIPANPGYLQRPVYRAPFLAEHRTYGSSGYPVAHTEYPEGLCRNAEELIAGRLVVLPWNENYSDADVDDMITALRKVHRLASGR